MLSSVIRYEVYDENSTKFTRFSNRGYHLTYNSISKICCDAVKNIQCYQFLNVSPKSIFADITDFPFIGYVIFSRNIENK